MNENKSEEIGKDTAYASKKNPLRGNFNAYLCNKHKGHPVYKRNIIMA